MFGRIFIAGAFFVAGAAVTLFGLNFHIVKTDDGRVWVPKTSMRLSQTLVDIRDWDAAAFKDHPKFTKALIDHGHEDLVIKPATSELLDLLKDVIGGGDDDD